MGRRRSRPIYRPRKPAVVKNEFIRHSEVRVLSNEGENVGVFPIEEAIELAKKEGLDLIEISPKASPPVTRIMEMGKYLYKKSKEEKKKKQTSQELKSVRIGLSTSKHDLEIKARKIDEFLEDGNQVEVRLFLRGRERANREFARKRLDEFLPLISVPTKVTMEPKYIGGGLNLQVVKEDKS